MFKTKKVKQLEEDICYWKQKVNELEEEMLLIKTEKNELENQLSQKDDEIMNLQHVKKENEIMKQYYKLDEEPSIEVQARVLADLRIHDMEYQHLLDKIEENKKAMHMVNMYIPMPFPMWRGGL